MTAQQDRQETWAELLADVAGTAQEALSDPLRADLDGLLGELVGLWVARFGGIDRLPADEQAARPVLAHLVARLTEIMAPGRMRSEVLDGAVALAYAVGVDHAAATAWWTPETSAAAAPRRRVDLSAPVAQQAARALSGLDAGSLARRGLVVAQESVARARVAARRVDATVAVETTRAAAQAVRDVAAERNAALLWVAERDGCLDCLAYAGETTTGVFPAGLSFADQPPRTPSPLLGPALHPACRCSLEVHDPADTAVPEALRREARRSVLRGWADDDSEPERLRAAERLLARGAGMPKTVEARARRAVRAGTFE